MSNQSHFENLNASIFSALSVKNKLVGDSTTVSAQISGTNMCVNRYCCSLAEGDNGVKTGLVALTL